MCSNYITVILKFGCAHESPGKPDSNVGSQSEGLGWGLGIFFFNLLSLQHLYASRLTQCFPSLSTSSVPESEGGQVRGPPVTHPRLQVRSFLSAVALKVLSPRKPLSSGFTTKSLESLEFVQIRWLVAPSTHDFNS